jgi:hypothetical protein
MPNLPPKHNHTYSSYLTQTITTVVILLDIIGRNDGTMAGRLQEGHSDEWINLGGVF